MNPEKRPLGLAKYQKLKLMVSLPATEGLTRGPSCFEKNRRSGGRSRYKQTRDSLPILNLVKADDAGRFDWTTTKPP